MQPTLRKQLRQFLRQADRRKLPAASFPLLDGDGRQVLAERRHQERRSPCLADLIPLFHGIDDEVIYAAIGGCHVVEYLVPQILLEFGQINRQVFILLSGDVVINIGDAKMPETLSLARGESVGEMSIADGATVSARVTAGAGSRLLIIDEDVFWNKLVAIPKFSRNLMIIQADRQRRSNEQLIEKIRKEMLFAQIKRDLAMAAEIQLNMLPRNFPLYPDRTEFDVYASMVPARDVGGDFYDAFMVGPDHLFFVIGDVSGKGVSAALFMVRAMTLFRIEAAHQLTPHEILHRVNGHLSHNNDRCMFVTVICGVLDVRSGKVTYSNAGHGAPLLGGAGGFRLINLPFGTAVGLDDDSVYTSLELSLQRGEMLFLYTDGVTDAIDGQDQLYSEKRLLDALNAVGTANSHQTVNHISKSIEDFSRGVSQFDDITMLVIAYRSDNAAALAWNDDWNVGIFELDRQHQYLLDLLNQMADLVQNNPAPALPAVLIDEFRTCSSQHIEAEERMFSRLEPLHRLAHEQSHRRFEVVLERLLAELASCRERDAGIKTVIELRSIWLQHIEHQDAGLPSRAV